MLATVLASLSALLPPAAEPTMTAFSLTSSAFHHDGDLPARFTCEGEDVSPPLTFQGVPTGTRALALIVDDPDAPDPAAPKMTWVHWVLFNLAPDTAGLPENAPKQGLPKGTLTGKNDWKKNTWGGPCPPIGKHRYFFKLYALDAPLALTATATKSDVEKAMAGHVLAQATLVGRYQKSGKR